MTAEIIPLRSYGTITRLSSSNLAEKIKPVDQEADLFLAKFDKSKADYIPRYKTDVMIIDAAFLRLINELEINEAIKCIEKARKLIEEKLELLEGLE